MMDLLGMGVAYYIGNAMINTGLTPQEIAEKVLNGDLDICNIKEHDVFDVKLKINDIAKKSVKQIKVNRNKREEYLNEFGE
jgi:beta-lysine 5,6-aminomutase alpha subunit